MEAIAKEAEKNFECYHCIDGSATEFSIQKLVIHYGVELQCIAVQ